MSKRDYIQANKDWLMAQSKEELPAYIQKFMESSDGKRVASVS
jgi:hypothetical protein